MPVTNAGTNAGANANRWADLPRHATVLVDTAPFIYVLESHPQFADQFLGLFEAAASGEIKIALSTITLAEVLTGPFKANLTALAKRYEKALLQYEVVAVSSAIATLAAQLRVQYKLKLPDAIQLATALDIGAAAFITHDQDFSRVTGVEILTGR
jgi:predicted nucleic acid-binding protein